MEDAGKKETPSLYGFGQGTSRYGDQGEGTGFAGDAPGAVDGPTSPDAPQAPPLQEAPDAYGESHTDEPPPYNELTDSALAPPDDDLPYERIRSNPYPDTELDETNCASRSSILGKKGEAAAARYLERRGYEILERNWRCPVGEADIIAIDEDELAFIEVKTRSDIKLGMPSEAVDARKREKYEKIAGYYLRDHRMEEMRVRFDVIGILVTGIDRALLRHHVNAYCRGD